MNTSWNELAARAGLTLIEHQHDLLQRYLDLLLETNRSMNLTTIADPELARAAHVGDALTLLPFLPAGPLKVVDVGSGGGLPGMPLAIARPDLQVTLIEATRKKAVFLRAAAKQLNLTNVQVVERRAEDAAHGPLRQSFDVAVARALASLPVLLEWCLPLVRKGGKVLAMKGPKIQEELPAAQNAISVLGGGAAVVHPVALPHVEHHVIVEIDKIADTPAKYPRPTAQTKSKPL
jgi:16S rRNA (guanine527-N7)-methyltransferase